MQQKLISRLKTLLKPLFAIALIVTLVFSHADGALAARSGGRIGGGSFRAPTRSYTAPSRGYQSGGGYYGGGGFGFPFLIPFFGFGGGFGGLFTIFIAIAIGNFLVQSFRRAGGSEEELEYSSNPTVSVARIQVGLLAEARGLQTELDQLAFKADTGTATGRAQVLQEATLSLLRHPEYWKYAGTESQQAALNSAEAKFNQLALGERAKFTEETLSNFNSQIKKASSSALTLEEKGGDLLTQDPGEYIVVTLVVGTLSKLQLPVVRTTEDLRQALRQIGGIGSDQLLAVEVLWTPQASGDTLTSDDMVAGYPDLKLI
jgi:uncharacterized membrane protein